jgi:hypothetical protein
VGEGLSAVSAACSCDQIESFTIVEPIAQIVVAIVDDD